MASFLWLPEPSFKIQTRARDSPAKPLPGLSPGIKSKCLSLTPGAFHLILAPEPLPPALQPPCPSPM